MITIVNGATVQMRGLSTDTKPLNHIDPQTGELVVVVENGATFLEIDTGKKFMFNKTGNNWIEQPTSGGGSAGVSSLGGATGAITLDENFEIDNNELKFVGEVGGGYVCEVDAPQDWQGETPTTIHITEEQYTSLINDASSRIKLNVGDPEYGTALLFTKTMTQGTSHIENRYIAFTEMADGQLYGLIATVDWDSVYTPQIDVSAMQIVGGGSSGGTQLYKHTISINAGGESIPDLITIISTSDSAISSVNGLYSAYDDCITMNINLSFMLAGYKNKVLMVRYDSDRNQYFFGYQDSSSGVSDFQLSADYTVSDNVTEL